MELKRFARGSHREEKTETLSPFPLSEGAFVVHRVHETLRNSATKAAQGFSRRTRARRDCVAQGMLDRSSGLPVQMIHFSGTEERTKPSQ